MNARWAVALLLLWLGTPPAVLHAQEPSAPGSSPKLPAALQDVSDSDLARARQAVAALVKATRDLPHANQGVVEEARVLLLGAGGLRAVAERLWPEAPSLSIRSALVAVVAQSTHPAAAELLGRLVSDPAPEIRMMVAMGLGVGGRSESPSLLAALLEDSVPGVRMAALRSLFAFNGMEARRIRAQASAGSDPEILAQRLRWHRLAGDGDPHLLALAETAWRSGQLAPLRLEAARLLISPALRAPAPLLRELLNEHGATPEGAHALRAQRGQPTTGYDGVLERRIAIGAAFARLEHHALTLEERKDLVDQLVGFLAHRVPMDPYLREPIPEDEILLRLPAQGELVVEPTIRHLLQGDFPEPRPAILLLQAAPPDPAFRALSRISQEALAHLPASGPQLAAAWSGLRSLGRAGDLDQARRLVFWPPTSLRPEERHALQRDVLTALGKDPASEAAALLAAAVAMGDETLRIDAEIALRNRGGSEAFHTLLRDFFERPVPRTTERFRGLLRMSDEGVQRAVLRRALADGRPVVWQTALRSIRPGELTWPDPAVLSSVLALEERLSTTMARQDFVYALLVLNPEEAVSAVRRHWSRHENVGARATALQQLQEVRGPVADRRAVDLVLDVAPPETTLPPPLLHAALQVLEGRFAHRAREVERFLRTFLTPKSADRLAVVRILDHPGAPDLTDLLLPLMEAVRRPGALPPDMEELDREERVRAMIDALAHQPWERVEGVLADIALDRLVDPTTRQMAIGRLKGRLTEGARRRLLAHLNVVEGPPRPLGRRAAESGETLWMLGQAAGAGGDERVLAQLLGALDQAIESWFAGQPDAREAARQGFPESAGAEAAFVRIQALARAVVETRPRQEAAAGLCRHLLDPRFGRAMRARMTAIAADVALPGPASAARRPDPVALISYAMEEMGALQPDPVWVLAQAAKSLEDAVLAEALGGAVSAARDSGTLAQFPDLYFALLGGAFLDRSDGSRPKTAHLLAETALSLPPIADATDFRVVSWLADWAASEGAVDVELEAITRLLHLAALLDLEEEEDGALRRSLAARRSVLQAARDLSLGKVERAEGILTARAQASRTDAEVLTRIALTLVNARHQLEWARQLATQAVDLETRIHGSPSLDAANALAMVHLQQGRPETAWEVLVPLLQRRNVITSAYHLTAARILAALRDTQRLEEMLYDAFLLDRDLAERLPGDPWLAPFQEVIDRASSRAAAE